MEVLLALVVIVAVLATVAWPFVRPPQELDEDADRRAELEIAKQNKYREIRDLELDFKAGKLDEAQWAQLDGELRREAMAILAEIDSGAESPASTPKREPVAKVEPAPSE